MYAVMGMCMHTNARARMHVTHDLQAALWHALPVARSQTDVFDVHCRYLVGCEATNLPNRPLHVLG